MGWFLVDNYGPNTTRSGCLVCGNGEVRKTTKGPEAVLSTGFTDDFLGTPDICGTCIEEAAKMLGWVPGFLQTQAVEAREAAEQATADIKAELSDKIATIRTLTAELSSVMGNKVETSV